MSLGVSSGRLVESSIVPLIQHQGHLSSDIPPQFDVTGSTCRRVLLCKSAPAELRDLFLPPADSPGDGLCEVNRHPHYALLTTTDGYSNIVSSVD